jgi:hypothetical protein
MLIFFLYTNANFFLKNVKKGEFFAKNVLKRLKSVLKTKK